MERQGLIDAKVYRSGIPRVLVAKRELANAVGIEVEPWPIFGPYRPGKRLYTGLEKL